MQFSTNLMAAILFTVTSVAGFALPVPAPSPLTVAEPFKVVDAIVPRQTLGLCDFGDWTCSGGNIYQCNGGWQLIASCGRNCQIINGSPFCV
ncbi:hypothetical protein GLAREA_06753 [Glarea lozoyensis ATCC 20868]|uniref:Uncharacterized protein n=1 Tax=Glarea lozoyensis (strain ATCC 20868 / MF5171) TaxID=1116229 RepID=S3D7L0_GLAL2|nr:uncharacterized protein GLAREA_06753 [Glarea lozoyensis ATCC 20868]EPE33740.1 hypothetical protein GLAREA_06753 [Glarea lozoyensis ATCC 20868]